MYVVLLLITTETLNYGLYNYRFVLLNNEFDALVLYKEMLNSKLYALVLDMEMLMNCELYALVLS